MISKAQQNLKWTIRSSHWFDSHIIYNDKVKRITHEEEKSIEILVVWKRFLILYYRILYDLN